MAARRDQAGIVRFLRDLIAIPAESCKERARCERVLAEYKALGFSEAFFDGLGSVVAIVGSGPFTIMFDGHIDTVGVGDPAAWIDVRYPVPSFSNHTRILNSLGPVLHQGVENAYRSSRVIAIPAEHPEISGRIGPRHFA